MTTMDVERFHSPHDAVPVLALFIMPTNGGTHTGILHRIKGDLFIQDMQWHERFRSVPCRERYYFVVPALEEEEINDVTGMCRLIHGRHNSIDPTQKYRIPYAFRYRNNVRFNVQTAELMLGDGLGLTCSTFVLTVFESVNIPLVDFNGWQVRPDDNRRHDFLLGQMKNGIPSAKIPPAHPDHVARVQAELPCIRVRPEEVAATGFFDDLPAGFTELEPAGQWILERLAEHPASS